MFHIRVIEGTDRGEEVKTLGPSLTIGRSPECRLALKDRMASRVHGELYLTGRHPVFRDLQSHNGTVIHTASNQRVVLSPLLPEWNIGPKDFITIGETVIEIIDAGADDSEIADPDGNAMTVTLDRFDWDAGQNVEGALNAPVTARLESFLRLPAHDPTDVEEAKRALGHALLDAFPQADCVAAVDIVPQPAGELAREAIVKGSALVFSSEGESDRFGYSFSVLKKACQEGAAVCLTWQGALPETESVMAAAMTSCMAAPIVEGERITGFIHIQTSRSQPIVFSSRDLHLFSIICSIASLLIRQAKAAQEQAAMQTMASVGQVVAGLSHDAKSILRSVGTHATAVEAAFPDMKENKNWDYVRQDLDVLRFLAHDSMSRIAVNARAPKSTDLRLSSIVADVIQKCQRYYIQESDQQKLLLQNKCHDDVTAFVDRNVFAIALMNLIKNAIEAYGGVQRSESAPKEVIVADHLDEDGTNPLCVISVVDDAGGIPQRVLSRLGNGLISTKGDKGTGLGVRIVLDGIERLGGQVKLATSESGTAKFLPGTVVSLCLPVRETDCASGRQQLVIESDYEKYRNTVEVASALSHEK